MKYIYIKKSEDRVVTISKVQNKDISSQDGISEYVVPDNFDLSKEVEEGVFMDGFLTASEFITRYDSDYVAKRSAEYPDMGEQLDYIYHNGIDAWKSDIIDPIKAKHPKPQETAE